MIGSDGAGETNLLYRFKLDESVTTIPTVLVISRIINRYFKHLSDGYMFPSPFYWMYV